MTTNFEILVTAGRQAGARAALRASGTSIGSELDADIVLFGTTEACLLEVTLDDAGQLKLTVKNGVVRCAGVPCSIGEPRPLMPGESIIIGGVSLVVQRDVQRAQPCDSGSISTADASAGHALRSVLGMSQGSVRTAVFGALGLSGIALASVGFSTASSEDPRQIGPDAMQQQVRAALDDAGYGALTLEQGPDQRLIVAGAVGSRDDHMALESLLSDHGDSISLETREKDQLEETVADLYRVNGIAARVMAAEGSGVRVATREADVQKLEHIEAAVRADIPTLGKLVRVNRPPKQRKLARDNASDYVEEPGKRVMTVVSGDPAYVVTEDRSRYFVGSALPTGHRITSIRKQVVTLDKAGLETKLKM